MKMVLLLNLIISLSSQATSYKEFGENGGPKDRALEKLGKPNMEREFAAVLVQNNHTL